ncbi:hypothetical protein BO94DRAFT_120384 [Aspergillus sclerotioniger CBS 115572]|uniref:Uncharacterized protein n=1 Tax=Aspergillus sclerotioniger CBS 115572 TaxID=1450535 RepID=A0A317WBH2_9EURO|nr:hypothetical protein BO94DRAFT_120384 [Aspergillus sclerotioniger CBS 115572]PWY83171.1 hypothetical protein BO94DRAFT_120384 [Aspergillus sclerotioniger CBS 115572]
MASDYPLLGTSLLTSAFIVLDNGVEPKDGLTCLIKWNMMNPPDNIFLGLSLAQAPQLTLRSHPPQIILLRSSPLFPPAHLGHAQLGRICSSAPQCPRGFVACRLRLKGAGEMPSLQSVSVIEPKYWLRSCTNRANKGWISAKYSVQENPS